MLVITISSQWFQWAFFIEWSVLSGGEEKHSGDIMNLAFELITVWLEDYRQVDKWLQMSVPHGVRSAGRGLLRYAWRHSGAASQGDEASTWSWMRIISCPPVFCEIHSPFYMIKTILVTVFKPSESFQLISILHFTCATHLSLWILSPFYRWESWGVKEFAQT